MRSLAELLSSLPECTIVDDTDFEPAMEAAGYMPRPRVFGDPDTGCGVDVFMRRDDAPPDVVAVVGVNVMGVCEYRTCLSTADLLDVLTAMAPLCLTTMLSAVCDEWWEERAKRLIRR